jgi:putative chitinase
MVLDVIDGGFLLAVADHPGGWKAQRQAAIVGALEPHLRDALAHAEITSLLRVAHFVAQIAHESDSFATFEEYSTGRAYEGRADLGNDQPGDGERFKGRGPIQITGRANYLRFGRMIGMGDRLLHEPELAAEPVVGLALAAAFWTDRDLNRLADRDDLRGITRRINGGFNGLAHRGVLLGRAKVEIGRRLDWRDAPMPVPRPEGLG